MCDSNFSTAIPSKAEDDVFKTYAAKALTEDCVDTDTLWKNKCKAWIGENKADKKETVNHPSHYNHGDIEVIDFIESVFTEEMYYGFCIGNCIKYLARAPFKHENPVEDLKKCVWYLQKEIDKITSETE